MRKFVGNVILEGLTSLEPLVGWKPIAEKVVEVPDDPDAVVWHVCCYQVDEQSLSERLGALAKAMHPHWYAHFLAEDDLVVILSGKFFWAKGSDKTTWREFITYGDTIGIDRKWTENMATQHPAWVLAAMQAAANQ